jgi:nitroimidazol reductase NimA-like FMN-containing flavoprotein (pyridoxamine 5'-phosphate oxidase superfamily)
MRRKDFECHDMVQAYGLLRELEDGTLVTYSSERGFSVRPMNFVRVNNKLYFHGARNGEKHIGLNRPAVFNAYESLSLIPSYWFSKTNACPATTFFRSIVVKGNYLLVDEVKEKAIALQKLMEKLQPEGMHLPIDKDLSFYEQELKRVSVFSLSIDELSFKVKLGQNWKQEKRNEVAKLLLERSLGSDLKTVQLMKELQLL